MAANTRLVSENQQRKQIRIDPLFNDVFVRVFGSKDSVRITRSLLNCLMREIGREEIDEVISIEAEHTEFGETIDCHSARFDVMLTTHGKIFDLEAQSYETDLYLRNIYYASKIVANSLKTGQKIREMPQVVIVTLLDTEPLFPEDDIVVRTNRELGWNAAEGIDPRGSDRVVFVLVELKKFERKYNRLNEEVLSDELLSWLYLLTNGYADQTEVDAIMEKFPTLEEFAKLYGFAIDSPDVTKAYELYAESERERLSSLDYMERKAEARGEARGIAIGEERGEARGRAEGIAIGEAQGKARVYAMVRERMRAQGYGEDAITALLEGMEADDAI